MLSHPSSLAARQRRSPETSSKAPASARGRTRIGVLKPVARTDSTSCRCLSSSKRVRYWYGEGRIATIGMDRSAAWWLILSPWVWVTASAPAARADQNRARSEPENSRPIVVLVVARGACLLGLSETDRSQSFSIGELLLNGCAPVEQKSGNAYLDFRQFCFNRGSPQRQTSRAEQ